ncbi:hypothetical protein GOP47_0012923 [Adiantum capillus-veneris]|uniref:Myb/SANT-like DNA-binding domain-containing protein n=1 Tax=Adiantum capillus-veneris TaxID=13818 RepID=A0A9D4ZG57_ADICA|nr:hypothetical protein GOP47_0012923 [Adiantum capillus-veneris]
MHDHVNVQQPHPSGLHYMLPNPTNYNRMVGMPAPRSMPVFLPSIPRLEHSMPLSLDGSVPSNPSLLPAMEENIPLLEFPTIEAPSQQGTEVSSITNDLSSTVVVQRDPKSKAKKPSSSKKGFEWSTTKVVCLITFFQEKWTSLGKGNFKQKHWSDLAQQMNLKFLSTYTAQQCKNKWDSGGRTFDSVRGQRCKKRHHLSEAGSSLGVELKARVSSFAETMKEVELCRIEAKVRRIDADERHVEKALKIQVQIARILAGGRDA